MCFAKILAGLPTTVNIDNLAPQTKHEKTHNFCAHEAELQQTVSVFSHFYVRPSTTVNNDVIASNIKHEKTHNFCAHEAELQQTVSVFSRF